MDKFTIRGGRPLMGSLRVSGSKNTALPLMAGSLLADGTSTLSNIPQLRDVNTFRARAAHFRGIDPVR